MSDFLGNLVERSLSPTSTVRPQVFSIFGPPVMNGGAFLRRDESPELGAVEQHDQESRDRLPQLRPHSHTTTSAPATQFVAPLPNARLTSPESTELSSASPQTRTRIDLPERSTAPSRARCAIAEWTKEDEGDAAPLRPQLPAKNTPSLSSANKPVPYDSTKDRPHQVSARTIMEVVGAERELIQVGKIRAVQLRVPSPRLLAPAHQPKNAPDPPSVNVTIGRIEIRAVPPPTQQRARPKPTTVLSLEEYLRQRGASGGPR